MIAQVADTRQFCPVCHGNGLVPTDEARTRTTCSICGGSGIITRAPARCRVCDGKGYVEAAWINHDGSIGRSRQGCLCCGQTGKEP